MNFGRLNSATNYSSSSAPAVRQQLGNLVASAWMSEAGPDLLGVNAAARSAPSEWADTDIFDRAVSARRTDKTRAEVLK